MRKHITRATFLLVAAAAIAFTSSCSRGGGEGESDQSAAAQVYVPVGKWDKYYAFLSGGQSGTVVVYGLPSGRLIRSIPVFEPRAAYG